MKKNIDYIVISSYAFREEITGSGEHPQCKIVDLYDEVENLTHFTIIVLSILSNYLNLNVV